MPWTDLLPGPINHLAGHDGCVAFCTSPSRGHQSELRVGWQSVTLEGREACPSRNRRV